MVLLHDYCIYVKISKHELGKEAVFLSLNSKSIYRWFPICDCSRCRVISLAPRAITDLQVVSKALIYRCGVLGRRGGWWWNLKWNPGAIGGRWLISSGFWCWVIGDSLWIQWKAYWWQGIVLHEQRGSSAAGKNSLSASARTRVVHNPELAHMLLKLNKHAM